MDQLITCKVCGSAHKSYGSLSKHIRDIHKISSIDYYSEFYSKGSCVVCGADTRFINISRGFEKTCGHRCGAILHRQQLRNDVEKFNAFRMKVVVNMTALHESLTDEQAARRRRIQGNTTNYDHLIKNADRVDKALCAVFNI